MTSEDIVFKIKNMNKWVNECTVNGSLIDGSMAFSNIFFSKVSFNKFLLQWFAISIISFWTFETLLTTKSKNLSVLNSLKVSTADYFFSNFPKWPNQCHRLVYRRYSFCILIGLLLTFYTQIFWNIYQFHLIAIYQTQLLYSIMTT